MAYRNDITADYLRSILDYDPETGIFKRRADGKTMGTILANGYLQIRINGVAYYAHRLAWLHSTGEWPNAGLDHINGKRTENQLVNLREANARENAQNMRPHAESGLAGAYYDKRRNKWYSSFKAETNMFLGYFDAPEEAHSAYCDAKRLYHSFHPHSPKR